MFRDEELRKEVADLGKKYREGHDAVPRDEWGDDVDTGQSLLRGDFGVLLIEWIQAPEFVGFFHWIDRNGRLDGYGKKVYYQISWRLAKIYSLHKPPSKKPTRRKQ